MKTPLTIQQFTDIVQVSRDTARDADEAMSSFVYRVLFIYNSSTAPVQEAGEDEK